MFPELSIGSFTLPTYGLVSIVGFALAILVACYLSPQCGLPKIDILFSSFYGIIALVLGAKLLYFITYLPNIIRYWDYFKTNFFAILLYGFSGFVFYGGLLGLLFGIFVYCKQFHIRMTPMLNILAPAIPLMHAFGRIGCFLGGCCYGVEYHGPLAIQYPSSTDVKGLADVTRFPTPLVESAFNFILFIVLFFYVKKGNPKHGKAFGLYFIAYPIARFILEFTRGDLIRGHFLFLSTSQWISLFLLPFGLYLFFRKEKAENKQD